MNDPAMNDQIQTHIAVVTGTRAEFGLLRSTMHAIQAHPSLNLSVIATGCHLLHPDLTYKQVKAEFDIADTVPMQKPAQNTRADDAQALGLGISRITRSFSALKPDWVLVLGDRIEAFAAAAAASIMGLGLAHIHGGDRAQGIADESIRHAITKLAHLHFPATPLSQQRLIKMGENPATIHMLGSPAIDDLANIPPLANQKLDELDNPDTILLFHPTARPAEIEEHDTTRILEALKQRRTLALHPNHDPSRQGILRALTNSTITTHSHLSRQDFAGLLKSLSQQTPKGFIVGNSSSALIEAAALGCPAIDIGPRQQGREKPDSIIHIDNINQLQNAIQTITNLNINPNNHPYGDGHTGVHIAQTLANIGPPTHDTLLKQCTY